MELSIRAQRWEQRKALYLLAGAQAIEAAVRIYEVPDVWWTKL